MRRIKITQWLHKLLLNANNGTENKFQHKIGCWNHGKSEIYTDKDDGKRWNEKQQQQQQQPRIDTK